MTKRLPRWVPPRGPLCREESWLYIFFSTNCFKSSYEGMSFVPKSIMKRDNQVWIKEVVIRCNTIVHITVKKWKNSEGINLRKLIFQYVTVIMKIPLQVDTMRRCFPVFDRLRKEFLAGEMIWTFSDYHTLESKYNNLMIYSVSIIHWSLQGQYQKNVATVSYNIILKALYKFSTQKLCVRRTHSQFRKNANFSVF